MQSLFSEIKEMRRVEEIGRILLRHGLGFVFEVLKIKRMQHSKSIKEITPKVLRKVLDDLGGTFVKLGQFMSVRPDLIPHEYCIELSKLQNKVKPFPTSVAKFVLGKELNDLPSHIFKSFSAKPVAAASVGQVHKGMLKDGRIVAVKLLRPKIRETMVTDTLLLYKLATLFKKYMKQDIFDPVRIVDEFRLYTENELNYMNEARALEVARDNFKGIRKVHIPNPIREYCTKDVLVMDFLEGVSLQKAIKKFDKKKRKKLAQEISHIVFKQVFIDGFFHADLHPGNIFVLKHEHIGLLDFGIVGRIDEHMKHHLIMFAFYLMQKDIDGLIKTMGKLGFYTQLQDSEKLKQDLILGLGAYYNVNVEKVDIAEVFVSCLDAAQRNNLHVPTNLVLLGKTVLTLKGVVEELDPSYNLVDTLKPFIGEIMRKEVGLTPLLKKAVKQGHEFSTFLVELPEMTEKYFQTATSIESDLHTLTQELQLLTKGVSIVSRQFTQVLLLLVFMGVSIAFWKQEPLFYGVGVIGIVCGTISIIIVMRILLTRNLAEV